MSNYPPPYGSGRYSPGRPAYSDRPPFPPTINNNSRDYPSYNYPSSAPPPSSSSYRNYDPYSNDGRPPAPYPQPRDPYAPDSYDPYSPSTAYHPPPSARYPNHASPPPPRQEHPPPRPIARPASPPRRVAQSAPRAADGQDLKMLTPAVTASISGFTTAIYSLPPSHLPLVKYIAVNPGDCVDIHRALCRKSKAVWYADGCSRAGEGWCAAIEWIIDMGSSGRKMRECIPGGDGLDSELGAICKAVEGFHELLEISIKQGTPMSHEMIIFCDSAAAIVAIDTSSRPLSLRFDQLWRQICSEFIQAHITFVWLPKNSGIEGHVLADKIAVVAASNSVANRKKAGTLPDAFKRMGGAESAPSGSAEPGPWQRGDADPSRRKEAFERPRIEPIALPQPEPAKVEQEDDTMGEVAPQSGPFAEGEGPKLPSREAVFVICFPDNLSAKDLGVLFAQFGDLTAVDIYHTDPSHPRFAYVEYTNLESGDAAISALHDKAIDFTNKYNQENAAVLADWQGWQGHMKVVRNEPRRFIPRPVEHMFPNIAGWMVDKPADLLVKVENKPKDEGEDAGDRGRKRTRSLEADVKQEVVEHTSGANSPTPHKRPRQDSVAEPKPAAGQLDFAAQLSELIDSVDLPQASPANGTASNSATDSPIPAVDQAPPAEANGHHATPGHAMPPTPQTAQQQPPSQSPAPPPAQEHLLTPTTAAAPSPSIPSSQPQNRAPLTNSAAEPQEYPIKLSVSTLHSQVDLVSRTFVKHDVHNWIAHSCLIAVDLDQARRALQADLYATDEGFLSGRELEQQLLQKGYTAPRVDAFVTKVLKVLDGIALAEAMEGGGEGDVGQAKEDSTAEREALEADLEKELQRYPEQTREAVKNAGVMLEYLHRGKELQEKKRLDVERRVKVLEGMVKIGEVVGGVVRFLLTEASG